MNNHPQNNLPSAHNFLARSFCASFTYTQTKTKINNIKLNKIQSLQQIKIENKIIETDTFIKITNFFARFSNSNKSSGNLNWTNKQQIKITHIKIQKIKIERN